MKNLFALLAISGIMFTHAPTSVYAQEDFPHEVMLEVVDSKSLAEEEFETDSLTVDSSDIVVEEVSSSEEPKDLMIWISEIEFFGAELIDFDDFIELFIKAVFNFLIIGFIVRYLYYPATKNKDYLFTYLLISVTVFSLCFLLENVKLELGFALGLFAIFGIIRYRTDPIPIKEMTYLFIVIGVSVINALANKKISHTELIFTNLLIISVTYGLEKIWLLKHESRKTIMYEKIELITPDKNQELIDDLKERTGLNITRVEIRKVDFLRDTAQLRVFYFEDNEE